jgi:hypothetical protein
VLGCDRKYADSIKHMRGFNFPSLRELTALPEM